MPHILKTEAICLRSRNWRETSKIVTLLTPGFGLIKGIARGARRPKNPYASALDLFAHSQLLLYLRENRDLCTIGEAELIDAHTGIALDYSRYRTAGEIVNFLLSVLVHRNPEQRIFQLLKNTLSALAHASKTPTDYSALKGSFLLKAASFLGFRPQLQSCVICHNPLDVEGIRELPLRENTSIGFDIPKGGVVCSICSTPTKIALSLEEIQILKVLLHTAGGQLLDQEISQVLLKLITDYAQFHLEIKRR
ncbi:MAG: DNA repair protein RecO [candidate division WOR-3 bacterium]